MIFRLTDQRLCDIIDAESLAMQAFVRTHPSRYRAAASLMHGIKMPLQASIFICDIIKVDILCNEANRKDICYEMDIA